MREVVAGRRIRAGRERHELVRAVHADGQPRDVPVARAEDILDERGVVLAGDRHLRAERLELLRGEFGGGLRA